MNSERKPYKVIDEDTCREELSRGGDNLDPATVRALQLEKCIDYVNGHEEFHKEEMEPRIRRLEDNQLWVIASAATFGALLTGIIAIAGLLTGFLKWTP